MNNKRQDSGQYGWPTKKLERISPSTYGELLKCPLKACWSANRQRPAPIPAGPIAQLGSILHQLLEAAVKGKIKGPDLRQACGSKWKELLRGHECILGNDPRTAWMVPLEFTAFRFAEKLERSLGKAEEFARFNESSAGGAVAPGTSPWSAEQWLETTDKQVGGKVDLISREPEGVAIKDYKSGAIYETDEGTIKGAYSIQLKLYAAIYHDAHGEWPKFLELIPLFGQPQQVPFTGQECATLLTEAKAQLVRVNLLVDKGEIQDAANPSPECCRYCGFRPICGKYRDALQVPGTDGWPYDVTGAVTSILEQQSRVQVSVEFRGTTVKIWVNKASHGQKASLKAGDQFAAFDLARRVNGDYEVWKGSVVFEN